MTLEYLFIDDDVSDGAAAGDGGGADAEAYSRALTNASGGRLSIRSAQPRALGDVLRLVHENHGGGLLLDVSFVNAASATEAAPEYDGIALAQQIRILQNRGQLPSFPIVRLSKRDVVREYVAGDTTSDDLFDERVDKEDVAERREEISSKLISLAADYPVIAKFAASDREATHLAALLDIVPELLDRVDARSFVGLLRPAPAHTLAQYFITGFLRRPGVLIDEALLSVRLGVDAVASEDWPSLLTALDGVRYRGVFGDGYPRYWMFALADWWLQLGVSGTLKGMEADGRVEVLQEKLGLRRLESVPADPDSPGRRYWHRCVVTGKPVDPAEGFPLIDEWGHEPWHDTDYICLEIARRTARSNPRLRPAEKARALKARTNT